MQRISELRTSPMPLLGPDDPLPHRPTRVIVVGTSGSGKTSVAQCVAEITGVRHVEIDALYHGPAWVPLDSFADEVSRFANEPAWVTEWQYRAARELLAERANLAIWLDFTRRRVMWQVVRRTVTRRRRRTVLWNGNIEPPLRTIFTDPEHVIRWAWTTHRKGAQRIGALRRARPELPIIQLHNWAAVCRWCDGPLRTATRAHDRHTHP